MKSLKFIVVVLLALHLPLPIFADKRPPKKPMKELTDPNSPSYVPIPYPKNRKEVIADLKYYIEHHCGDIPGSTTSFAKGYVPFMEKISLNLISPDPDYEIGEVVKVKNRMEYLSDDYYWLILIMDQDGKIAMRTAMLASGIWAKDGANSKENYEKASPKRRKDILRLWKPLTDKMVKDILSDSLGYTVEDHKIITIERVAYPWTIGSLLLPVWEIKMTGNRLYYYSENWDMIYSAEKRLPWKKNDNGRRKLRREMALHEDYLPDTINDEFVILKKIPRKK